jgi:CTP synthase
MIELPEHPHFIACQFHPELKSRPMRPHPLFAAFVRAAIERRGKSTSRSEPRFIDHAPVSAKS